MDKFIARLRMHAERCGTPVRAQYIDGLAKRMIGELFGWSRKPTPDELDALDQSALADKFSEITSAHPNLLAPTKESPVARLDRANLDLHKKEAAYQREGAAPRRMDLNEKDRAALEKMSPAERLSFAEGTWLAPEFRK